MTIQIVKIGSEETAAAIRDNEGYCICAVGKTPDTKCMCKNLESKRTQAYVIAVFIKK